MKLLLANVVGLLVSLYLVLSHYKSEAASSPFCELGSGVSCSTVLRSSWAVILGVPVAVHGVSYFLIACGSAFLCMFVSDFRAKRDATVVNFLVNCVGMCSVFYFIAAEVFIGALCPLCTVVHLVILFSFIFSWIGFQGCGWVFSVSSMTDLISSRINFLLIAVVIVVFPLVVFNLPALHPKYSKEKLDNLAGCLTSNGVTMYGSRKCSHCVSQKAMFGEAFSKITFVECGDEKGKEKCEKANIKGYPTWLLENGERREGTVSMPELAKFGGCNKVFTVS